MSEQQQNVNPTLRESVLNRLDSNAQELAKFVRIFSRTLTQEGMSSLFFPLQIPESSKIQLEKTTVAQPTTMKKFSFLKKKKKKEKPIDDEPAKLPQKPFFVKTVKLITPFDEKKTSNTGNELRAQISGNDLIPIQNFVSVFNSIKGYSPAVYRTTKQYEQNFSAEAIYVLRKLNELLWHENDIFSIKVSNSALHIFWLNTQRDYSGPFSDIEIDL